LEGLNDEFTLAIGKEDVSDGTRRTIDGEECFEAVRSLT
jgi:hypothetical protein